MLFDFINAPAPFQRMVHEIIKKILFARAYLNDDLRLSSSLLEHFDHIKEIFELGSQHHLKVEFLKCKDSKKDRLSRWDISPISMGFRAILRSLEPSINAPALHDTNYTRRFLGPAGYCRCFNQIYRSFGGASS